MIPQGDAMDTNDKVVYLEDFRHRKENKVENLKVTDEPKSKKEAVMAIDELREQIIAEEKRKVKRTLLTEFIGASVILPGSGLVKVTLNDISLNGVSFDIAKKYGFFKEEDKVALRIYLNHSTYFPMEMAITNARALEPEGVYRHGAKFINESQNQEALGHFINFIETVNTSLRADLGDLMLTK